MIDPRTQYILHQERQHKLMAQIEQRLADQERAGAGNIRQTWYSAAQQWLKEKILYRENSIPAGKMLSFVLAKVRHG